MIRTLKFAVFCLLLANTAFTQERINPVLRVLRHKKLNAADSLRKNILNKDIQDLIDFQITYYKTGQKKKISFQNDTISFSNERNRIVYSILSADYFTVLKSRQHDSLVFKKLITSYRIASELGNDFLKQEALIRLSYHLLYRSRESKTLEEYLNNLKTSSIVKEDKFEYLFLRVNLELMKTEDDLNKLNQKAIVQLLDSLKLTVRTDIENGKFNNLLGIYQAHWLQNYGQSNKSFLLAKSFYQKIPYHFAQNKVAVLLYNMGINSYKLKDYDRAIQVFKKDLKREKEEAFVLQTHEWLYKCYNEKKQYEQAIFHLKRMQEIKDSLDEKKHERLINNLDKKYDFQKKEKELIKLNNEKSILQSNLYTLIPILGLATLILAVIFFLYRRYRKKSVVLEEEKSETLQKLDELKQIVIKNHIVLKDKTKVYISDLMYIKADDHYLNLFLSNGKNHFVRGKLKNIKEELPPNFIQCHRSYIVNANFIKQKNSTTLVMINQETIPLSRSFKDRF